MAARIDDDLAHLKLARVAIRLSLAAIALGAVAVLLPFAWAQSPAPHGGSDFQAARDAGLLTGMDATPAAVQAGQRAVSGGTRAGTGAACFNCHGMQGQGDAGGGFPRLAGLSAWYIAKQLDNYADGSRPNEVMTPIAVQMTAEERRNAGIYYATLSAPATPAAGISASLVQQGATLAAVGNPARGIQACVNCHGPNGIGMPPDVPYLAGQNPRYLELQLQAWHDGKRSNSVLHVMRDVATRMSAEERRAVSQYFASLPPPGTSR